MPQERSKGIQAPGRARHTRRRRHSHSRLPFAKALPGKVPDPPEGAMPPWPPDAAGTAAGMPYPCSPWPLICMPPPKPIMPIIPGLGIACEMERAGHGSFNSSVPARTVQQKSDRVDPLQAPLTPSQAWLGLSPCSFAWARSPSPPVR